MRKPIAGPLQLIGLPVMDQEKKIMFHYRHWNRKMMPTKHILICEDVTVNQREILRHFSEVFEHEGDIQFSVVCGSLAAAAIMNQCSVDLIILDHDMPHGNGSDLLAWLAKYEVKTPVITFSGIPENNSIMIVAGAHHEFNKSQVIAGEADDLIKSILYPNPAQ